MKKKRAVARKNPATRRGFTIIELLVVMATLALLGGVLITLVHSGDSGYGHVLNRYEAENEARIALSYITVKVRQNDSNEAGDASGRSVSITGGGDLRIDAYGTSNNYWLIGYEDSKLVEHVYEDGSHTGDNTIAENLNGVSFTLDNAKGVLDVTVGYDSDGDSLALSGKIYLRSETQ